MAWLPFITQLVSNNKEVVLLILGILAISYPKLPHPDNYLGTKWYFPYLVLHAILARVSVMSWDLKGGPLKLPGIMYPSLQDAKAETTSPVVQDTYTKPSMFNVPTPVEFRSVRDKTLEDTVSLSTEESQRLREKALK